MQCTIPWCGDKGAVSTPQPTASETLLHEDHWQIITEKLLLKNHIYRLLIYIVFSDFIFSK